jgi:hypothetical protein
MNIIFDLDSTLCEFMDPWFEWLVEHKHTNHLFKKEDCLHYGWIHENFGVDVVNGYFLNDPVSLYSHIIQPYYGAAEMVKWAKENFDGVEIVTHANTRATKVAKTAFVREHFDMKDSEIRFFHVLEEKVMHVKNAVLIDDYPLHIIYHMARNLRPAILFDYEGRNGWSKLRDYVPLIESERPDFRFYHKAEAYHEIKDFLRGYYA